MLPATGDASGSPLTTPLSTEYFFLRKLGPRTRLLNAFYGGGFRHDEVHEADWLYGACLLVRRSAPDAPTVTDAPARSTARTTDRRLPEP